MDWKSQVTQNVSFLWDQMTDVDIEMGCSNSVLITLCQVKTGVIELLCSDMISY